MATVLNIITDTLSELGVITPGEVVSPEDKAFGLDKLNRLLSSWTAEKIAVEGIKVTEFSATGIESYTFGTGGTGSTTRPVAIIAVGTVSSSRTQAARMVDANAYNAILDKARTGVFAETAYYNAGFPVGTLYVTPRPTSGAMIRIHSIQPFTPYAAVTDTVTLAPGYERAVIESLAIDMAPAYGAPGGAAHMQTLMLNAKESKEAVVKLSAEVMAGSAAALAQAMAATQQKGAA